MRYRLGQALGAIASVLTLAVATVAGTAVTASPAEDAHPWLDTSQFTGLTPDAAAASCWEVKQNFPESASGAYWLLTPAMTSPAQFWCDQETDGGGWVKVGQGRNGWETNAVGKGDASTLLNTNLNPAVTVQLPTTTVDGLMNDTSVTTLADGVRVKRALDAAGTNWQEVRVRTNKSSGWYWSFGAGWTISTWRVGTATGTGGTTRSFGSGTSTLRVDTNIGSNHGFTWGFSYGNGVTGTSATDTYLWTPTNGQGGARPFSEVYVRPQLRTEDFAYSRIGDRGTSPIELPIVPESGAITNPWGVTGIAGTVQREGDVEVQDMVAIGGTMFVGGNFRYVQQSEAGAGRVEQPFLAAFDATTGQFLSAFRPTLNEAVLALAATSDGRLAVGGKFTSVNGTPVTGVAFLNPSTGALSGQRPTITNSSSPGALRIETISVIEEDVFLGGAFTHTQGPTGQSRYTRNLARVNASTAMPYIDWRPEVNGTVLDSDVSADGAKVYISGFLSRVDTEDARSVAALMTSTPAALDPVPWTPTWSSSNKQYQRAIVAHGDRLYVGGSEHSMFSFDARSYERVTTHITDPKGDFQTLLAAGDFLYGGSHSNWFIYEGATLWPSVGTSWTRADTMGWMNAWRMDGVKSVSTFSPVINSRLGSGGWASAEAPDGSIWTGGDFVRARNRNGGGAWTGAFVRFALSDGAAPNTPASFRATDVTADTVRLAWNASAGGLGGGHYQILRDDRPIATTTSTAITVPLGGEQRYFVRAADATGNVSASSPVVAVPGGNQAPSPVIRHTVDGLEVTYDASGSTDDGSVVGYHWQLGDGTTSSERVLTHRYFSGGSYTVRLTVLDETGAWATAEYELDLEQPKPTDAYGALVVDDGPWAFWRFDEASGTAAADSSTGTHHATYQGGVALNAAGIPNSSAASFDGVNGVVVSRDAIQGPTTFSAEVWFNTRTTRGGKLVGFGNAASGLSSNYDRHIYMQDDGRLVFGVYTGVQNKITSDARFNDGDWHHAVATMSTEGMALYVDGVRVGTHAQTAAQNFAGYWRVGGDRTWGSTSSYLEGRLDEAAVYDYPLTAQQVGEHFRAGSGTVNQPPVADFSFTRDYLSVAFDASASEDPDGSVAGITWNFGDGTPAATGALVTHVFPAAGTYVVKVTVTDDAGASTSLQRQVSVEARPNEGPTASFDYEATYLDVAFDASTSSDPDGEVVAWEWALGDGSTAAGPVVDHRYAVAGSYDVTLTVTDDLGARATTTRQVAVSEPEGTPTTVEVVASDQDWSYLYSTSAPPSDWAGVDFTPTGWSTGASPIGYGSALVTTNLNPSSVTSDRPRAVYFRTTFDVPDVSRAISLSLSAIGDDGVVIYVNGVEIGRKNMPSGDVSHLTFATSARRVTVAQEDMLTVEVPRDLLVSGTNVIAAETHVNYRGTPDLHFWATAALTDFR